MVCDVRDRASCRDLLLVFINHVLAAVAPLAGAPAGI
jgi:hypothetical protein